MSKYEHDIIVFASKDIGFRLTSFLIEKGDPVSVIVAGNEDDHNLIELAASRNIPCFVFSDFIRKSICMEKGSFKWLLNLWSPNILDASILGRASHRLNIHPALVPHCQGNDNAAWIIRKNLPAGVSLIEMDETIDTGGVYVQKEVQYDFPIRGRELHERLIEESTTLFKKCWDDIRDGKIIPKPQDGAVSYHTRNQTEQDRKRNATDEMSLAETMRWLLAHDFSPNTTAELILHDKSYKVRLLVERVPFD